MTVYLIGYISADKSIVGRMLAELLGYELVNTDIYIESCSRQRVSDLFRLYGEDYLRRKERMILEETAGFNDAVVATGGSLSIYHDNIDMLLESSAVLYLHYSSEVLAQRLELTKRVRPSVAHLTGGELRQHVAEAMRLRKPIYSRAHHTIDMEALAMHGVDSEAKITNWIAQQLRLKAQRLPARGFRCRPSDMLVLCQLSGYIVQLCLQVEGDLFSTLEGGKGIATKTFALRGDLLEEADNTINISLVDEALEELYHLVNPPEGLLAGLYDMCLIVRRGEVFPLVVYGLLVELLSKA